MIEQIINKVIELPFGAKFLMGWLILGILFCVIPSIIEYKKNKRKSTTQKFKEGLIKK